MSHDMAGFRMVLLRMVNFYKFEMQPLGNRLHKPPFDVVDDGIAHGAV